MSQVAEELFPVVEELIDTPSCCAELRMVASDWLSHIGADDEKEYSQMLIAELEEDVTPIDAVIAFFGSDAGRAAFGPARANAIFKHAQDRKAKGELFCDCGACSLGQQVLARKDELLA